MSSLAVVALPSEDDYVNKISSQKVAHMTLLFLGEVDKVKNLYQIIGFVKHAADLSLKRFGLEVDHRGVLGEDKADVLFFKKSKWSGFETIRDFRSYLLQDNNIRTAYDSTEQFPEWSPHMTLGYPDTPAKPDERDYPGTTYVSFDRLAVWYSDFDGVEFPLQSYDWDMDVVMGNVAEEAVKNVLSHVGVKGMKWGVRGGATSGPQGVTIKKNKFGGKKLRTSGGKGHPAHADAISARTTKQIGKKSGLKSLSNHDLQKMTQRLQLEQSAQRLSHNEKNVGKKFISSMLGKSGKSPVADAGASGVKKLGKRVIKGAAVAAA